MLEQQSQIVIYKISGKIRRRSNIRGILGSSKSLNNDFDEVVK